MSRLKVSSVHNGIWYIWYIGIFGYSDDNMLLSPTQFGLQEMLKICEKYEEKHNLKFSTASGPCKKRIRAYVNTPATAKLAMEV